MSRSLFKKFIALGVAGVVATSAASSPAQAFSPQQDDQEKEIAVVVKTESVANDDDDKEVQVRVGVPMPKRWLGIQLKKVEGDLATFLGEESGIFVISVYPDSPAEAAGINAGDVILSANDTELVEMPQLLEVLAEVDDEDKSKIKLKILSKGKEKAISVTPAERPEMKELQIQGSRIILDDSSIAKQIDKELLQKLGSDEFKILRLGAPAMLGSDKDFDVTINRDEDGKKFSVSVTKEGEGPAKVKVTQGDDVEEYEVDDAGDLPEDIRVMVRPLLEGGVKVDLGKAHEAIADVITIYGKGSNDMEVLASDEVSARIAAIAKEAAEQSKAAREQSKQAVERIRSTLRSRTETKAAGAKEIQELRSLVEKLQSEIKELRKQLDDK